MDENRIIGLVQRLELLQVPGLPEAAASALALSVESLGTGGGPAFFVVVSDAVISVYMASERFFAVCQVASDGSSLRVSVPLTRVRRVARLDDAAGCRLTVELEADRSTATTQMLPSGESLSVQVPAGYEIRAASPPEVAELHGFHRGLLVRL